MGGALRVKGRHARLVAGTSAAEEQAPPDAAGTGPAPRATARRARTPAGRRARRAATAREAETATGRRARRVATVREAETAGGRRGRRAAAAGETETAAGLPRANAAAAVRRAKAALAGAATRLRASSRRTKAAVASAACLAAALTGSATAFLTLTPAQNAPKAELVNVLAARPAPVPAALSPSRSSRAARRGDQAALTFYEQRDPVRAAHVTEVIWTGPMLRVYTDLPASDADSKTAIALCETAEEYARDRGRLPAVFVHADRQAGYPVLANKMGAHDDCKLGRVP